MFEKSLNMIELDALEQGEMNQTKKAAEYVALKLWEMLEKSDVDLDITRQAVSAGADDENSELFCIRIFEILDTLHGSIQGMVEGLTEFIKAEKFDKELDIDPENAKMPIEKARSAFVEANNELVDVLKKYH